jgi:hypothetical protein
MAPLFARLPPLLLLACAILLCAQLIHALSWDRLPYLPPARSGGSLTALPLGWAFANESSSVAQSFFASLPSDAPRLNASWLICNFGGETTDGSTNEMFFTMYPTSLMPANRSVFVRTVGTGIQPLPRQQHMTAVIRNHMPESMRPSSLHTDYTEGWLLIFGGTDMSSAFNSIWTYDLNMNQYIGLGPYPPGFLPGSAAATAAFAGLPAQASLIDLGVPLLQSSPSLPNVYMDYRGCPWPQVRHDAAMVTIQLKHRSSSFLALNSTVQLVIVHGGHLLGRQQLIWGDIWALEVDSMDFFSVLNTQVDSVDGSFVLNDTAPCLPWKLLHPHNATSWAMGMAPIPRYGHSIVAVDAEEALYVYGGANLAIYGSFLQDCWRFDIHHRAWTLITPAVSIRQLQSLPLGTMVPRANEEGLLVEDEPELLQDASLVESPCPDSRKDWTVPAPRAYGPLLLVGDLLVQWGGASELLVSQDSSFVFNLTRLHQQYPTLYPGWPASPASFIPIPPSNVTCVDCWLALNNSLLNRNSDVPAASQQPLRQFGVTLPMLQENGNTHVLLFGGIATSNANSGLFYVLEIDAFARNFSFSDQCPNDRVQSRVHVSVLTTPAAPYYANMLGDGVTGPCANLSLNPNSGSRSRPGAPSARYYHSGVGRDDDFVIFGGATGVGQDINAMSDLWRYSVVLDEWTYIGQGDGNGYRAGAPEQAWPLERHLPLMVMNPTAEQNWDATATTMIMFGGSRNDDKEFFNVSPAQHKGG